MSLFRESAVSFGSSTIRYKLVSSANSFIVGCISVTMSFIKVMNKRGPSIEAWGNPIVEVNAVVRHFCQTWVLIRKIWQ